MPNLLSLSHGLKLSTPLRNVVFQELNITCDATDRPNEESTTNRPVYQVNMSLLKESSARGFITFSVAYTDHEPISTIIDSGLGVNIISLSLAKKWNIDPIAPLQVSAKIS